MVRKISGCFTGGALGALVDSFNIWFLGKAGITAMLGIGLRPEFTPAWLYPRHEGSSHHHQGYKQHRKKSCLSDIFDFD